MKTCWRELVCDEFKVEKYLHDATQFGFSLTAVLTIHIFDLSFE